MDSKINHVLNIAVPRENENIGIIYKQSICILQSLFLVPFVVCRLWLMISKIRVKNKRVLEVKECLWKSIRSKKKKKMYDLFSSRV